LAEIALPDDILWVLANLTGVLDVGEELIEADGGVHFVEDV
jgi:hypothetical protein